MAAPQPIENPQRSYEVFEKKHDMECTTLDEAFRLGVIVRVAASSPLYLRSQFGGLHVRGEQFRKARGIAARHAAFGRDIVDPGIAPGGGEASRVAGYVLAVHEAEIELGVRPQLQRVEGCEIGIVGARFRY